MAENLYNTTTSLVSSPGGVCDTDTTIPFGDTNLSGLAPNYRLVLDDEIMIVTAYLAGVVTVTRGVEGTVATAHVDGTTAYVQLTAGGLIQYVSEH